MESDSTNQVNATQPNVAAGLIPSADLERSEVEIRKLLSEPSRKNRAIEFDEFFLKFIETIERYLAPIDASDDPKVAKVNINEVSSLVASLIERLEQAEELFTAVKSKIVRDDLSGTVLRESLFMEASRRKSNRTHVYTEIDDQFYQLIHDVQLLSDAATVALEQLSNSRGRPSNDRRIRLGMILRSLCESAGLKTTATQHNAYENVLNIALCLINKHAISEHELERNSRAAHDFAIDVNNHVREVQAPGRNK